MDSTRDSDIADLRVRKGSVGYHYGGIQVLTEFRRCVKMGPVSESESSCVAACVTPTAGCETLKVAKRIEVKMSE